MPSHSRPNGSFLSWPIWLTYAVLFTVAVPWHWRLWPRVAMQLWLGMPAWVVISIAGSVCISLFTAWVLRRSWPDEDEESA